MKCTRKFMSLALAIVLTLALFPMSALAAESYGDRVRASAKVFDAPNGDNKTPYNLKWEDGAKGVIGFDVQMEDAAYVIYYIFVEYNGILSDKDVYVNANVGSSLHATADVSNFIVGPGNYVFYVVAQYIGAADFYSEAAKSPVYTHGGSQSAITVPIAASSTFSPGEFNLTAIKSDNTMWNHQFLGNDGYGKSTKLNDGVIAVATGGSHELFIKSDNSLWGWGNNSEGQLGDGTTTQRPYMEPVKIMDSVAYVHAGEYTTGNSSFAIKTDGSLWAWGENDQYQLGDGTNTNRLTPVKIMDNVASICHEGEYTFAVKQDGTLWGWGGWRNETTTVAPLRMGDGKTPTMQMENVMSAKVGSNYVYVIKSDNSLWRWDTNFPTPVHVNDNVRTVALGDVGVIKTDGTYWTLNAKAGSLGDGTTESFGSVTWHKVMNNIVDIRTSGDEVWALQTDGTLWVVGQSRTDDTVHNRKVFDSIKLPTSATALPQPAIPPAA